MSDNVQCEIEYRIGRLDLRLGDILVVKSHEWPVSQENAEIMRASLRERLGDIPILVIGPDIDLAVLTRAELEARANPDRRAPERIMELPAA